MRVTYKRLFLKKRYPLAISRGVITGSENLFVCVEAFGQTGVGELASTTTEPARGKWSSNRPTRSKCATC